MQIFCFLEEFELRRTTLLEIVIVIIFCMYLFMFDLRFDSFIGESVYEFGSLGNWDF